MLPGPEALQLAIYVGYLKRGILAGIAAGITFILPGAVVMVVLSWLYLQYGGLPAVNDALFVLKPAVLGIIAAGIIKLGTAAIKNVTLGILLVGAFIGMRFAGVNFLVIMLLAGVLNLLFVVRPERRLASFAVIGSFLGFGSQDGRLFQLAWLLLKTGLFSFGGAYASLVFLQEDAVGTHHWLTSGQLLDAVAISVATPGPFMLFSTFVGYIVAGVPGAVVATVFVFIPSFVFVLVGARYVEQVRNNRAIQAFLSGVSAAVVGVILVVSIDLGHEAISGIPSIITAALAFVAIVFFKIDVAKVAAAAMACGVLYAAIRGLH